MSDEKTRKLDILEKLLQAMRSRPILTKISDNLLK